MEASLTVVGGKTAKRTVKLKLPMTIGRSREARLAIAHPMVSRRHSELFEQNGLVMVRDLGSLNGTIVGGHRVKESPLPPDAEFTVGPLTFRVAYKYDGDLSKVPAPVLDPKDGATPPAAEADAELPDFEIMGDETAELGATVQKSAKSASSDPFDDLLSEFD
jgi:pSer/pThr/pTyr-binding forkhead associated (FHA) protein